MLDKNIPSPLDRKPRMHRRSYLNLLCFMVALTATGGAYGGEVPKRTVLQAEDFGMLADGKTDDGDAIQRMLAKARKIEGPVELRFPKDQVICVKSGVERYVFALTDAHGLRING
jgi:hypothetical protein